MLDSNSKDSLTWCTVTKSTILPPTNNGTRIIGRRRELIRQFLNLHVSKDAFNKITSNPSLPPFYPTEYIDNYCDSNFVPFMDRPEYDTTKCIKYPLYGGNIRTFYKDQLDMGMLKTSDICSYNEPFRRSCSFTTPPDLAIREPAGGY